MSTNCGDWLTKQLAVLASILGMSAFILPVSAVPIFNPRPAMPVQGNEVVGLMNPKTAQTSDRTSIAELAASDDAFDRLAQAVEAAGLKETLDGGGPYTVFAPTDEAFAALPEGTWEMLLRPENKELLKQVLMNHVVPGAVTSSQIATETAPTVNGGAVAMRVAEDRVIVNDASVVQSDIHASNGVIHAINRVLLPAEVQERLNVSMAK